jgi:hypothetical protein
MQSASSTRRRATRVVAALCLTAAALAGGNESARADTPTVIDDDATGFICEYYPEGQPQVIAYVHYDAVSGNGESDANVLSPDGERVLADGFTHDVQVADGVVSARYPLIAADGSAVGEVVLEGTYVAASDPVTLRTRNRYERNAQIIGNLTYTPLDVTWKTFRVGDFDVSGTACQGQRTQSRNRVLEPHRYVGRYEELNLLGRCGTGALTGLSVLPSEAGVTLALSVEGYEGFTNLDLGDGSDTQSVSWYAADAPDEPADRTRMTATLTDVGHRRTAVTATPNGLVLAQVQPVTLAYEVALPEGAGTVTGSCSAEATVLRTAVEPIDA